MDKEVHVSYHISVPAKVHNKKSIQNVLHFQDKTETLDKEKD